MASADILTEMVANFERRNETQRWMRDVSRGSAAQKQFLAMFPFRRRPNEINNLRSSDIEDIFEWLETKLRPLGAIYLRGRRPINEAIAKADLFRELLAVCVSARSLQAKLDDPRWAQIPGFGSDPIHHDRQIARKIIATYYPSQTIPVFNTSHMKHFCEVLGIDLNQLANETYHEDYDDLLTGRKWALATKALLAIKRECAVLRGTDNVYLMYCLYNIAPPDGYRNPPPTVREELDDDLVAAIDELQTGIKSGQRFSQSPAARRAIELRGMAEAMRHYRAVGWDVADVSKTRSYDLHCSRGRRTLMVEVKATTGDGATVLLTPNEVDNALRGAILP